MNKIKKTYSKISNWFQKWQIEPEITLGLTLYNIISLSILKIKFKKNPDTWSEDEKQKIENFLKKEIDISLNDFKECLKEELKGAVIEELETQIRKNLREFKEEINYLVKSFKENPFLTIYEFKKRAEVQPLLKYKRFVGREDELKQLHDFLNDLDVPIALITSEGGTGKTRLALEFSEKLNSGWTFYFIHTEKSYTSMPPNDEVLLILDESSRFSDRYKLLDDVLNPPSEDKQLKLLIIERPIFKDSTINDLREKNANYSEIKIKNKKGNIAEFLIQNLKIEKKAAQKIEKQSEGNFIYATLFADYYKEEGEISGFNKVLNYRVAKYIRDIANRINSNISDVRNAILILSLLTPIKPEECDKYFEEIKIFRLYYNYIKEIINLILNSKTDIIFLSDYYIRIKPDPLSDYLRLEFLNNNIVLFKRLWKECLPFMPFRILHNISIIPVINKNIENEKFKLLRDTWIELNRIEPKTPEYFSSLMWFTTKLSSHSSFDISKANIAHWSKCYRTLPESYPDKFESEAFALALLGIVLIYGRDSKFSKMEGCIKELKKLHNIENDRKVREILSFSFFSAAKYYGNKGKINNMTYCINELRNLYNKFDEREIKEVFSSSLSNATHYYGKKDKITKMNQCIKELEDLHSRNKERKLIKELSMALYNASNIYRKKAYIKEMEDCLNKLRNLNNQYKEKELRKYFSNALYNAVTYYGQIGMINKMEDYLKEIRNLHNSYQEKEIRKNLSMALVNKVYYCSKKNKIIDMSESIKELKELNNKYPEKKLREDLSKALHNEIEFYGLNNKFIELNNSLKELSKLHKLYSGIKIRKQLIDSLVNATYHYAKNNKLIEMEQCINKLKKLNTDYKEKQIRIALAGAFINSINSYISNNNLTKIDKCIIELINIYEEYQEKEITQSLAMVLFNIAKIPGQFNYGYTFLLYKLRFELPDDSEKQEKILLIEAEFIKATIQMVEEEYYKGIKYLEKFIKTIKAGFEDESEFNSLINIIREKLSTEIKNAVLKILN